MSRRSRRRRPQQQQQQRPAIPYIVVSDEDEDSDDPAGPHPWPARTVAAAAAAAAAIARAVRGAADAAVGAAPAAVQQQLQSPGALESPGTVAAVEAAAGVTPAADMAVQQTDHDSSEPAQAEEVGSSCTICYEPMYEAGSHRAASLKCGHIFGSECIRKWLQQKSRCPQCNQRSKPKEITLLFNLPKLAAGAAPEDIQRQLQELEASKRKEEQRVADLERSLKELQRQLAMREHQQLQQHQPPAAHAAAGLGMQLWQQQQQQRLQHSGPGGLPSGWSNQQLQQQQLRLCQQQRPPLQPIPSMQSNHMVQSAAAGLWQQQPQLVGQKRPWEQVSTLGPQQQQQQQHQQAPVTETPITWPLLALQPVTAAAAAAAACTTQPCIGPAGVQSSAAEYISTQATGGFAVSAASGLTGASAASGPPRRHLPGCFNTLQEFELCGSRSFYLDVPGTLALAAETPEQGRSRLRKISLVCPGQPSYTQLPADAGVVRCLASQKQLSGPGSSFDSSNINPNIMAVATDKAGLLIASLDSQNIVQSIPVSGPVWSVAWSPQHPQQLLLGLDKGRIAVADFRKSSREALLFISNAKSSCRPMQPLHSLIPLQHSQLLQIQNSCSGSIGSGWGDNPAPEAVVACAGGVYSWGRLTVNDFNLLLPSITHGGNCESITLAPDGGTLAVSFRSPLRWSPPPPPAAAAECGGFINSSSGSACVGSPLPKGLPMHLLCKLGKISGLETLRFGMSSTDHSSTAATAAAEVGAIMGTQAPQSQLLPTQSAQGSSVAPVPAQTAAAAGSRGLDPSAVAAALKVGQEQLIQQSVKLYGHSSSKTLTLGCFIPGLPSLDAELLFLSADEPSCQPCLWGCSSGALFEQRRPWQSLPGHILQLAWGQSDSLNALLVGAMSDRRLVLYEWQPDN